ncbi:hypothetical protein Tco_0233147 [Tanacetum coccineum]
MQLRSEISTDVLEIYMQEFWVTVSRHHSSLCFKLNGKSHTVNVDNFRDMLKICPKLPSQIFEEPPLEEEILSFIRDLGHTGEIKFLSDVNVNHMHQPWRSFAAIINKCLSGKTTALENLVYQVENKNSKKNNDMYYPRFTKVIVDYFMAKDQGIPRRNKMFWHYARDDFMFSTSEAYMAYRAYATGEKTPKPKTTKKKADSESSPKTMSTQASKGKRITTLAKGDKPAKKKQSATKSKGLTVLSEVALTEAQQMKIAIERSKIQTHSSHASGLGNGVDIQSKVPDEQQQNISSTNEGAGDKLEVLDVPEYRSESEEESWTYSQGEDDEDNDEHDSENDNDDEDYDQENVSGETKSDNDGDDFMVSTPPDYEITEEEENQEDDDNVMGGEQEDEEDEELYGDLNLDLKKRDAEMTDAQVNQVKEEVHVTFTIEHPVVQQQTHDSTTTTTILATTLSNIPNFAYLFGFERRVSSLETELSELKQTNQFAEVVSFIPGIIDNYLASKMKDEVNVAIQLKLNKLREEAQAENEECLNKIESNIKGHNQGSDKDEEPSVGSNRGTKRRRSGKEESSKEATQKESKSTSSSKGATRSQPKSSGKSAQAEEHGPRVDDLEKPSHQEFNTGNDDVSPAREVTDVDARLWNLPGSQTPDREWNKTKTVDDRPPQSWMTQLAQASGTQSSFNEFLATPIDFSAFIMNRLKINNLTQDVLTGPTYDLMKGTCKSVVELEYHLEEVFKATHDQLDWHNPEGRSYPHDLSKPLPLIQNARRHQVIPFDHFINNDLEYLKRRSLSQRYTTLITKTKAAKYGHVKWIEDKVPRRKLTNLNLDERFALNVTSRMYTRRIVIQERVEDLQLAVKSYQKKINLSGPDVSPNE